MERPLITEVLQAKAKETPDQTVISFITPDQQESQLSYAELDTKARTIAAALQARNLKNKCVLLLYEQSSEYVCALFGCLYAGAIPVPFYPPLTDEMARRLIHLVKDADIQLILTTHTLYSRLRFSKLLAPIAKSLGKVLTKNLSQKASYISTLSDLCQLEIMTSDTLSENQASRFKPTAIQKNDIAYLQYTSGSTTEPKGVIITHENLIANLHQIKKAYAVTHQDIFVSWLPIYHDMGLVSGVFSPIYLGMQSVLMSPFHFLQKPLRWLKAISDHRATITGGPDFAYRLCMNKISDHEKEQLDLSHLRLMFCGAEHIHADTFDLFLEKFRECGLKSTVFLPTYGLAEAVVYVSGAVKKKSIIIECFDKHQLAQGKAVLVPHHQTSSKRLVSVGEIAEHCLIEVVDTEKLLPLQEGMIGEIWIAGPNIVPGYWKNAKASAETMNAQLQTHAGTKFLRTGDLGFMLSGDLYITGRIKDLIIIAGANHYPQDIEYDIEKNIADVRPGCIAAFSVNKQEEERLVIVAEVKPQTHEHITQTKIQTIITEIKTVVSEYHRLIVEEVVLIQARTIPKTTSGKLRRASCAHHYLNKKLNVISLGR